MISTQRLVGCPSMYLKGLQETANRLEVSEKIIRHKFLGSCPSEIATVLASRSSDSLENVGKLADQLQEILNLRAEVNQVEGQTFTPKPAQRTFQNKSYTLTPFHPDQKPKICRSHIFYGRRARSCKPWCVFQGKEKLGLEPSSRSGSPKRASSPSKKNA
eukprot:TRINITY_DN3937_c0_g1_i2.p2 TRINITY_DN3937_c0_g1~~TRINITY_DN3937_c0_g1_i2.p2  ORF type:complete len:160 (+),score=2.93 TRINITY_DN3937_c0_g1_i2:1414-1893(+)